MLDALKLNAKEIREFLPDGETGLACISADYFSGRELSFTPLSGEGDVIRSGSLKSEAERGWHINPFDASLSIHAWDAAVEKLVSGTTLIGAPGSMAGTLSTAITPTADLLLTNQRLTLVANLRDSDRATNLVWWCAVQDITTMRHIPRGILQRGRVGIVFSDHSSVALITGTVTSGKARQLVNRFQSLTGR
ncbi:hypothetical protein QP868_01920 [Brevibacterium sp. UMB1308A]|uniref:hypothetical protein n=1 Tax=Brevibacterium sp. UMB1308A TaxID=3050608 RepID=UPI00254D0D14|nr:hypothetical protein [Brevibacterium sp. UMB1308A]MDK8345501.1 hypothetical protein [Brevibacterium sp. UMB1308B]MDK8712654.1 hypothetical protein [Brevibacterium sp. UMB1308A]